jgi:hypothetical protein
LRKYLIAALAALTAVALTTVAVAQQPEANMTVKVSPTDAGTKKKPKNGKITFHVENANSSRTLSKLTIRAPSTVKVSTKGLTKCSVSVLETQGPSKCPRASRVGTGVAHALLGVNTGAPSPLTFDVTAVVTGSKNIGFHLHGRELPGLNLLSPGTISGRDLNIQVPAAAQQPAPGTFAGLVSIDSSLSGKKGSNFLVSISGCKNRKQPFQSTLTFINNGVTPAGTVNTAASSRCSS